MYRYELNCDQYVLTRDGRPIGPLLDEVCLALDVNEGFLRKHGSSQSVLAWVSATREKLRATGFNELASGIVSISGRFPLEELNRCLSNTSYVGVLYQRIQAGLVEQQEISPPAATPANRRPRP